MNPKQLTIAIDGFSSTGKSTLAKDLAVALGLNYIDSGAMYRAVALYALENNLVHDGQISPELVKKLDDIHIAFQFNPTNKKSETFLNGRNVEDKIRSTAVSAVVSEVAAIPEVRRHLVYLQKNMGKTGGVVMDGRDIGSVVFPDAELKIFMTADEDVRVLRRWKELKDKGYNTTIEEVRENLNHRDHLDTTRADSPLIKTEDAIVLDNSNLSQQEQLELAISWANKAKAIVEESQKVQC
ncbi:cytidylate kinase [Thermaurantimonas aggregans]|uniref:Cytidylate kinase n=1 Tax=Thermaurantimonas aggregans TaxID=2173829 RepID=A0A401XJJ6_9FLAO|nr:(d)CMP kinase [Thermaurantimonas aggregans]MCX8148707.1 (d)CMP kinase [Thermaurantimonas aggregans]GCD77173.1 cytidylate kinase [Thermaurantimonas aggregans]